MTRPAEYWCWRDMRRRCADPSRLEYPRYGGRGIRVCAAWQDSFEAFRRDVGARPSLEHTLDRIDNDGHYEPGNVRWATSDVQQRKKRSSHFIEVNGERMCIVEWAERMGLHRSAISHRLAKGWTPQEAVTIPKGGAR